MSLSAPTLAVERARRGSQLAPRALDGSDFVQVAKLVRKCVERLQRKKRLPAAFDTDDLAQHVLLHLYAHDARVLLSWKEGFGTSYRGYLAMVAQRAAISALRRRDLNPRGELQTDPSTLDAWGCGSQSSEDLLMAKDFGAALLQRLGGQLSPLGRSVLVALYGNDMTIEEASAALGMSVESLYAWRARIKQRARSLSRELTG